MTALAAFSHVIRTTLVLALVGFLAFGSLAGPVSAATGDHHAAMTAMDGDHDHPSDATANCPAKGDAATHEMGDGSCCVGTCTTILGIAPVGDAPMQRIVEIEPFEHPVLPQSRVVEFIRPPSPAI